MTEINSGQAENIAFLSLLMESRFDEAFVEEEKLEFDSFLREEGVKAGSFVIGIPSDNRTLWIRYFIANHSFQDGDLRYEITQPLVHKDTFLGQAYPSDWGEIPVFS